MAHIESHRDLLIWQKAMDLAVLIYRLSSRFPQTETYALTSQLTRAAVSVPANIAEGSGRSTAKDYANFLYCIRLLERNGNLSDFGDTIGLSERRAGSPRHRISHRNQ